MPYDTRDYYRVQRLRYGDPDSTYGSANIAAGETKTLCTVSGEGTLYMGYVVAVAAQSGDDLWITVFVDGTAVADMTISNLLANGIWTPEAHAIFLEKYDSRWWKYQVSLAPWITFEKTISLRVKNDEAFAFDVSYGLFSGII